MSDRTVLSISGTDRTSFLQNLVTNDVENGAGRLVYAALLTPQGKFIADFFVLTEAERLLIDVATSHAATLAQRLTMYRLRAAVEIEETDIIVSRGTGPAPDGVLSDPRHPALGWRYYGNDDLSDDTDWAQLRVAHQIPETGIELTPDSYILEMGFETLNGVDFKKGCYIGQEIVARMKHKTTLRKGLARVSVDGGAEPGDAITADGKAIGTLLTVSGNEALAYLRFDRSGGEMAAGQATLTRLG